MGEDAKDWGCEEPEGATKVFADFGGGFEAEDLAFISQGCGLNKSRLTDHMSRNKQRVSAFNFASALRVFDPPNTILVHFLFTGFSLSPPLCKMTGGSLGRPGVFHLRDVRPPS